VVAKAQVAGAIGLGRWRAGVEPAPDRCAHGAGLHNHHLHAGAPQFAPQAVAEGFERELRARIGTEKRHRHSPSDRTEQDHATLVTAQAGQQQLRDRHRADHVDFEHAAQV